MPPHTAIFELGERSFRETLNDPSSEEDQWGENLRSIKKTGELSVPPTISLTSPCLRLDLRGMKEYAHTVDLTTPYVEKTGKFREVADQEVFLIAKTGDPVALAELIFRAVRRNEAFVISATHSICTRDPAFEPECILSCCLAKLLGSENSQFFKEIESASHFYGRFRKTLRNHITDGYRKLGVRPKILTNSQMGVDDDNTPSLMDNLPNEQGLYADHDETTEQLLLVLQVAIKRCLNADESEHFHMFAQGVSLQERMDYFGFDSPNTAYGSIKRIRDKLKNYINKHPDLFEL